MGVKHCPKCGSTNLNPFAFYCPSILKCLDCGYEGAFIVEDGKLVEKLQERYQKTCNIIDWAKEERHIDNWDCLLTTGRKF